MPTTPPGSILDGLPGYGSQVLTFSISGPYVADSFSVDRPFSEATDLKTDGEPNRSRYVQGKATLTGILQAPTGTSGWPVASETFTITLDDNYGPEQFVMMWVPQERTSDPGTLRKINFTAKKVIIAITSQPAQAANT